MAIKRAINRHPNVYKPAEKGIYIYMCVCVCVCMYIGLPFFPLFLHRVLPSVLDSLIPACPPSFRSSWNPSFLHSPLSITYFLDSPLPFLPLFLYCPSLLSFLLSANFLSSFLLSSLRYFGFQFHPTSCLPEEQKDKGTKEGQKDRSADGRTARKNRRDEWDGQKGGIPFLSP